MANSLCRTFITRAVWTWEKLERAHVQDFSLGEESITDFNLLYLKEHHPNEVIIKKFAKYEEGRSTGADWEWWLFSKGRYLGFRIQAKRLDQAKLEYEGLNKKNRKTHRFQYNLLINEARRARLIPLYVFYNSWGTTDDFGYRYWKCGSFLPDNHFLGCTIAPASIIRTLSRKNLTGLSDILPLSLPWSCLVCCKGYSPNLYNPGGEPDLIDGATGLLTRHFGIEAIPTDEPPDYVLKLKHNEPLDEPPIDVQYIVIIKDSTLPG